MIDNYEQIKSLMSFELENTQYFLSIYKRKKDQSEDDGQKSDNVLIKDYFIKSFEHFDKIYPEVKKLCDFFNARAYIRLNRILTDKVALETLSVIVDYIKLGNHHNVKAAYTTACGTRCYDPEKKWIIDIDLDESLDDELILDIIQNSQSGFENNIIAKIPTKNGFHYITHPFDTRKLNEYNNDLIHKNNPTLLYCK